MTCPTDVFVAKGSLCRPPKGECDKAETCTGTSAQCPEDSLQPEGFLCHDSMYFLFFFLNIFEFFFCIQFFKN